MVLNDIYEVLYADSGNSKMDNVRDLTRRLNTIAKADWTYRYVNSVLTGSLEPGKDFVRAMEILASLLDGQSPVQARLRGPIAIYSTNGLKDDDIIIANLSRHRCDYPGCGLEFVGWSTRKYCSPECKAKARKLRRQDGR